ncbi:MAG: pyridoxamine 5'-phosphate oxidase family protein [Desulfovibrio sp.]|uniref:pyridoxamine 5'-phosphate oxidase family protein n=1 Tax=Desulfovibrio sp. 7SRBS1 TaxID=3378064 RepID=UPI003B3EDCA2
MLDKIQSLVRGKDICVLATVSENHPHCSLMSYMASEDCRSIYLVTSRSTKKFQNSLRNPNVSLLIDTREDDVDKRDMAKALTIEGCCHVVENADEDRQLREAFVQRCPNVRKLVEHPDSAVIRVQVTSFLLLDGVIDSYFVKVE